MPIHRKSAFIHPRLDLVCTQIQGPPGATITISHQPSANRKSQIAINPMLFNIPYATWHSAAEFASFIVTIFGLPLAVVIFWTDRRKELENEEEEAYQVLSDSYIHFLGVVMNNSDLQLRTSSALQEPTIDQRERMMVVFEMLVSLFERAYLISHKAQMTDTERRRWNSWDDAMREWCQREDFIRALPQLLKGEDPEFARHIGAIAMASPWGFEGLRPAVVPTQA